MAPRGQEGRRLESPHPGPPAPLSRAWPQGPGSTWRQERGPRPCHGLLMAADGGSAAGMAMAHRAQLPGGGQGLVPVPGATWAGALLVPRVPGPPGSVAMGLHPKPKEGPPGPVPLPCANWSGVGGVVSMASAPHEAAVSGVQPGSSRQFPGRLRAGGCRAQKVPGTKTAGQSCSSHGLWGTETSTGPATGAQLTQPWGEGTGWVSASAAP